MLFGGSGRMTEALQAQLILAVLLLAILPITILYVPAPTHAIILDLWPLPGWPAGGDTAAMVRLSSSRRERASYVFSPSPPGDRPLPRIELTAGETILFEGRPVDLVRLRMELDLLSAQNAPWLELRPHPEMRYERFVEVLAAIARGPEVYLRIDNGPFREAIAGSAFD